METEGKGSLHANQRKKRNRICEISTESGTLCSSPSDIGDAFLHYYQSLFSSSNPTRVDECLEALEEKVTQDMNAQLVATFTQEEICVAISQMSPYKSPGLDGFPPCFY